MISSMFSTYSKYSDDDTLFCKSSKLSDLKALFNNKKNIVLPSSTRLLLLLTGAGNKFKEYMTIIQLKVQFTNENLASNSGFELET